MTVKIGDPIPDVEVKIMTGDGPKAIGTAELLGRGKVVLFAVPGAFTPGCSRVHLPGFVEHARELTAKGVETIACVAVNDVWVMEAWARDQGADDTIVMVADGNGDFAEAMGLTFDGQGAGLGRRSQRYAAVLDNGVITHLDVESKPGVDVSSCEAVLRRL
ncbi:peroxiredoxin [Frankia sp. Cppng1_Ct_nod]|uniref:peroxiredoxin n=1 Tax=Frankia sp. Cppng1_Ct_nod TaxID=2897162 RepID=UPI0010412BF4|nr:peroxiredoxin [Frankia sp. Cppng1_Ct_nod]